MRLGLAVLLVVSACASSEQVLCEDGTVCPPSTTCTTVNTKTYCVTNAQLEACANTDDEQACGPTGTCHGGACFDNQCGNALVDVGEACDDGNQVTGDGCSGDCVSNETCGNGVIDGITGEQCDDNNLVSHDGCDSLCTSETPVWSLVGAVPSQLRMASSTYDEARGVVVVFGGIEPTGAYSGDTWLWNGRSWAHATPPIGPSPRFGAAMAYDAKRRRVVLFGGKGETGVTSDTWEWDGERWTFVPTSDAPTAMFDGLMAYDAKHGRIILWGGDSDQSYGAIPGHIWLETTWSWDGVQWRDLAAFGPPARGGGAMAYDPVRGKLVVFGGFGSSVGLPAGYQTVTWEFDGIQWETSPASPPSTVATGAKLAWDAARNRIVLFGGRAPDVGQTLGALNDTVYGYDGTSWSPIVVMASDFGRTEHVFASDTTRKKLVVWSGLTMYALNVFEGQRADDGGIDWLDMGPVPPPAARNGAATDTSRGRTVTLDVAGAWEFDGVAWAPAFINQGPTARTGASVVYDEERKQILLFGGLSDADGSELGDTWRYTASGWQQLAVTGPAPRHDAAIVYDAVRKRVLLFGGNSGTATTHEDTWLWDGVAWTQATPATVPLGRARAGIAFDVDRGNVVMFGGVGQSISEVKTWLWDGSNWKDYYQPQLPHPTFRQAAPMAWDPARRRIVLFGGKSLVAVGTGNSGFLQDTWEWGPIENDPQNIGWSLVKTTTPPDNRAGMAVAPNPRGAGIVVLGGQYAGQYLPIGFRDTWRLRWESSNAGEVCRDASVDLDGDGQTSCKDDDCAAVCSGCGDGTCNAELESCRLCPSDCGACPAVCGDYHCDAGETASSCPGDCP